MKFKVKRVLAVFLAAVLMNGSFSLTAFAGQATTSAIAESRTYDGTTKVKITDMYFASAAEVSDEDYERLSADAEGTLSSPNAGTYNVIAEIRNIVLKERHPEIEYPGYPIYDFYSAPEVMNNIASNVIIEKALPDLSVTVADPSGMGGSEISITVKIANDFGYPEGLPTADQIRIDAVNATLKEGESLKQNGNEYTAVFVLADDAKAQEAVFSANVTADAVNYSALEEDVSATVTIMHGADYSKVDEAIAKANALNKEDYIDFSKVEAAINAVVRGKYSTEQDEVDAMAQAIEEAILKLEKKTVAVPAEPTPSAQPSGNTEETTTTAVPKTGEDDHNAALWLSLALVLSAGVAGVSLLLKKKRA
ncbi:LPXTG cell wall anchor domain-containing protein [Christensenellaceae bacterium NSJ-44]|uniref:LPXTG cell wall anchor domain-containing protein n=1 Tax=Luoshenia tenuis TaxID=2763654 RepID=A0A926D130_9FIRM|nr:LPXTG cell wall anchor domain-containing protein [Luoshenia tenuis]MBC8529612.1 LPXTG cell wall anchor domain-containing protein [Luoshenia tenuis]